LALPVQAASVTVSPNVVLNVKYGKLTVLNSQQYDMFVLYANGTMFFNYTGLEDHVGHYAFTAQSYGNGSLVLRFKGAVPTVITQASASTSYTSGYEQITYTTSQTSALNIQFYTNPRFSLTDGALAGATAIVAVIVIRTAYITTAKDAEERQRITEENKKIFLVCGVILLALLIGASLFP
jgi:hypothetical protein